MSTNINTNVLKAFVLDKIGTRKLDEKDAKKVGIDEDKFEDIDVDENDIVDIDELLDDKDLYNKFATMLTKEEEEKAAKDKEKEKEEQSKVSGGQGGAKA